MTSLTVFAAKYLVVLPLLVLAIQFLRATAEERTCLIQRGIVASLIVVIGAKLGGTLIDDPRPFVKGHFQPLIPHAADNGFPSDHTLLAFTAAFLLVAHRNIPFSVVAIVAALGVGLGRIGCGLHSPLDVLGSVLIAGISVGIPTLLVKRRTRFADDSDSAN